MQLKNFCKLVFPTLIMIVVFSTFSFSISQDDFCNLINENMTISQCNSIWAEIHSSNITYINQTFNNTQIQNYSVSYSELKSNLSSLIEDVISDYDFSKIIKSELKDLDLLESDISDDDCDDICILEKQIKSQIEIETTKLKYCSLYPTLTICSQSVISNVSSSESETSDSDLGVQLITRLDDLSSKIADVEKKSSEKDSITMPMLIIILVVGFVMFGFVLIKIIPRGPTFSVEPLKADVKDKELKFQLDNYIENSRQAQQMNKFSSPVSVADNSNIGSNTPSTHFSSEPVEKSATMQPNSNKIQFNIKGGSQ